MGEVKIAASGVPFKNRSTALKSPKQTVRTAPKYPAPHLPASSTARVSKSKLVPSGSKQITEIDLCSLYSDASNQSSSSLPTLEDLSSSPPPSPIESKNVDFTSELECSLCRNVHYTLNLGNTVSNISVDIFLLPVACNPCGHCFCFKCCTINSPHASSVN